ncbi:MAG: hypothetical protein JNJ60_16195 [Rhodocyclaceae bacterium]|nr:hypothetical protein [Rhodocyclaceae bacterium]
MDYVGIQLILVFVCVGIGLTLGLGIARWRATTGRSPDLATRAQVDISSKSDECTASPAPDPRALELDPKSIDLQEYRLCVEPVFDELNIYSKTALYAPVLAPVRVHRGGIAVIAAPVHGDLVVHAGAAAVIYGILLGNLTNNGGTVHVYGSVFGKVSGHGGETRVFAPPVREQ